MPSFASDVKNALSRTDTDRSCCQTAELAALLRMGLAQDDAARPQADALLAGGVVAIAPGFSLLGPVPGRREGEITVYVRTGPKAAEALSETARSTYRQYTGKQIGAPLRLEVNPLV